jgi:hypothetical protein
MLRIERTHELPVPRSQSEIRADDDWARQRGIDWSTAVFSGATRCSRLTGRNLIRCHPDGITATTAPATETNVD